MLVLYDYEVSTRSCSASVNHNAHPWSDQCFAPQYSLVCTVQCETNLESNFRRYLSKKLNRNFFTLTQLCFCFLFVNSISLHFDRHLLFFSFPTFVLTGVNEQKQKLWLPTHLQHSLFSKVLFYCLFCDLTLQHQLSFFLFIAKSMCSLLLAFCSLLTYCNKKQNSEMLMTWRG